jgi:hypothetical protein
MTKLQKRALDALDEGGSMTLLDLETACRVTTDGRGGFRTSIQSLLARGLVRSGGGMIWIRGDGVRAIEEYNLAQEARCR